MHKLLELMKTTVRFAQMKPSAPSHSPLLSLASRCSVFQTLEKTIKVCAMNKILRNFLTNSFARSFVRYFWIVAISDEFRELFMDSI